MAARPGRVVAEIPIDAPLPRDVEFRHGAFYAEHARATSQALHMAMDSKPLDDGAGMLCA
jgi:NitT/TauT family transport system ATP-binding protein